MYVLGEHDCWSKQVTYVFINISSAQKNQLDLNNHILSLMFSTFTHLENCLAGEQVFNTQWQQYKQH